MWKKITDAAVVCELAATSCFQPCCASAVNPNQSINIFSDRQLLLYFQYANV